VKLERPSQEDLFALARARIALRKAAPYLEPLALKLIPFAAPGMLQKFGGKVGVLLDKGLLLFEPGYPASEPEDVLAGILAHECLHFYQELTHRFDFKADPSRRMAINVAADRAINPMVLDLGLKLPSYGVMPKDLGLPNYLSTDEYLQAADDKGENAPQQLQLVGGKPEQGQGKGTIEVHITSDMLGELPGDIAKDATRSHTELRDAQEAAESVAQAAGNMPDSLRRFLRVAKTPSKVDWRKVLESMIRRGVANAQAGGAYSTFTKPSRKQAGLGYGINCPALPAHFERDVSVTVLVDTSGSLWGDEAQETIAKEIDTIIRKVVSKVKVCVFDARVQETGDIRNVRDLKGLLTGGGGTDFRPPIEWASEPKNHSCLTVMMTDACGPWPSKAMAKSKLIVCLIGKYVDNVPEHMRAKVVRASND